MRRIWSLLLLLGVLGFGTGLSGYLHRLEHSHDHASSREHGQLPTHHDESACAICANVHAPLIAAAWVPLLVSAGLLVAFLTQLAQPLVSQLLLLRIDCRGPPAS
jgi:hypothetical protein